MKKKLLSLALALVLCLGLAIPAFAAEEMDWSGAKEVKNFEEFLDAVLDEKVEKIKIVGEVTIPKPVEYPLTVETPVLVGKEGKLTMAPDSTMFVHVPMGRFNFEDREKTWDLVAEMCETFIMWHPDEDTYNRDIFGTMQDINQQVKDAGGEPINCLVVSGGDVNLTDDLSVEATFQVIGHDLTVGKGVKLEVGGALIVDGNLTLEEGASLTVGEGSSITGKATFADEKQKPENLEIPEAPAEDEKPAETPAAAPKFTDVAADSPFAKAIDWAVAEGITLGTTETTFGPGNTCSISNIITFLWRANGKPGAAEGVSDRDGARAWAIEQKLIGEDEDVSAPCTRVMAVGFMWGVAGKPESKTELNFTDIDKEADYAGAVAWAVENKVTAGTGDGTTFEPEKTCTRGQIVTFLYRSAQAEAAIEAAEAAE